MEKKCGHEKLVGGCWVCTEWAEAEIERQKELLRQHGREEYRMRDELLVANNKLAAMTAERDALKDRAFRADDNNARLIAERDTLKMQLNEIHACCDSLENTEAILRSRVDTLRRENEALRFHLAALLDEEFADDEGPEGEGWHSERLHAVINAATAALKGGEHEAAFRCHHMRVELGWRSHTSTSGIRSHRRMEPA